VRGRHRIAAALLLAACSDEPAGNRTAPAAAAAPASAAAPAADTAPASAAAPAAAAGTAVAAAPSVKIEVDGTVVATVGPGELTAPRPVADLLPQAARDPSRWLAVQISGGRRRVDIPQPASRYRGHELRLYARDGQAGAGLVAGTHESIGLHGIDRVAIHTEAPAPPELSLVIASGGREVRVGKGELERLPVAGERERQWRLVDVAGLAGAGAGAIERVTVIGEEDRRAVFARAELLARDGAPVLRLNRRGTLRLDRLARRRGGGDGDGRREGGAEAIRAAVRLEVDVRPPRR